jgi:predicted Zn-dependent peptidase
MIAMSLSLGFVLASCTSMGLKSKLEKDYGLELDVKRHRFDNGLTLLTLENHQTPTLSFQSWFKVGSMDETEGKTGLAHLFEHMMFQGAKKYSGEEFEALLEQHGAQNNAYTSRDMTVYYEDIRSDHLELVLDLESDRLKDLRVNAENFKSEVQVVREERKLRVDNSPYGTLNEALWKMMMPEDHPYRWPIIGYSKDLKNMKLKDAQEFYETFYDPSRLTLVLIGDFETKEAVKLVEKYYKDIPSKGFGPKRVSKAPEPLKEQKRKTISGFQTPWVLIGFRIPPITSQENLAGDVLSSIMSSGETSWLKKKLVLEEKVATQAFAYSDSGVAGGLFVVGAQVRPGQSIEKTEKLLWDVLNKAREEGSYDERDLASVMNKFIGGTLSQMETNSGLARMIGRHEVLLGSYERILDDLIAYQSIDESDLADFSNLLTPEKAGVLILDPNAKENK